jgi:hypothetical protein
MAEAIKIIVALIAMVILATGLASLMSNACESGKVLSPYAICKNWR